MLELVKGQSVQIPGGGAQVIEGLAKLYRANGRRVLLFESSQALNRVTREVLGHADPDDVFTVDYISGHQLKGGKPVNVLNRLTATPRILEHFVAAKVLKELDVKSTTQGDDTLVEGGDFTFIPDAITRGGQSESTLVMGKGLQSRTNDKGRAWLGELFSPDHTITVETDQFHRDLVSAFLLGKEGHVVQVLLAQGKVANGTELNEKLSQLGIETVDIPEHLVKTCALNVSVNKGDIIGMQSFGSFEATLRERLAAGVTYHVLPVDLQEATKGFTSLQGGANCVSGSIIADPKDIDSSPANIRRINELLHGGDFEDELRAYADALDLHERVKSLKEKQEAKD